MFVKVLCDIMTRVAAANYDRPLAHRSLAGTLKLARMAEAVTFEFVHTFDLGELHLTAMTGCLNDMPWVQSAVFDSFICLLTL